MQCYCRKGNVLRGGYMTVLHTARRHMADDNDSFIDSDVGFPNPKAQRRGHKVLIVLMLLAGVVALIGGLAQGAREIAGAFPTVASLLEGAAWMKLLSGLSEMATVGLIVIVIAMIWRWRIRHRRV